jgi:predicted AAA+ superfamily ATPase
MFAHHQGGLLNAAQLARGLGVSGTTIAHYLDLMVDLLLVRRLAPRLPNIGKRLVRSPKVYVRDSGLVHALLGLADKEAVLGHPIAGPSWEGMAIESILAAAGAGGHQVQASFYRTGHGAEIDLVLTWPGGEEWAVEIKRSLAPTLERGFHSALADLHRAGAGRLSRAGALSTPPVDRGDRPRRAVQAGPDAQRGVNVAGALGKGVIR